MGRAKATLPIDHDTFLTRIVRTFLAAGVDDVVVVVGHEAETVVASFAASGLPARFVALFSTRSQPGFNSNYWNGCASTW